MNTKIADTITGLLRRIVSEFILSPKELRFEVNEMANSMTINIVATRGDVRRIIGTDGAHFKALSAFAQAMGRTLGVTVDMDQVDEPITGAMDRYPEFAVNENWPEERVRKLCEDMAGAVFKSSWGLELVSRKNGTSNIDLTVYGEPDTLHVQSMGAAFKILFKAIGRANGRRLYLNVVPRDCGAPEQPATAAGRFASETSR